MGNRFQKREREIMELIYLHDMTYPEIAKQFDITDRRVSQIHLDVLARLNKLVKKGIHTRPKETRNRTKKVGV
jgi:DNA-directed RNA polymerase specialized sigma subunit